MANLSLLNKLLNNSFAKKSLGFPSVGISSLEIKSCLLNDRNKVSRTHPVYTLGTPRNIPHPLAVYAEKLFLDINPNNIGDHSDKLNNSLSGTRKLENEVIKMMTDLFAGKQDEISGYITSGATEGILFSSWAVKKNFRINSSNEIYLLKTTLTHKSVNKAADILNLTLKDLDLTRNHWTMSAQSLQNELDLLNIKGIKNFILLLTCGYTSTGGVDDIRTLSKIFRNFMGKHTHCQGKIIVDAAFGGLTLPFFNSSHDLNLNLIDALIVDFHKMGEVPFSCGLVLYKRNLRRSVTEINPYLGITSATLLGSRPGTSAAAAWSMVMHKGISGFSETLFKCLKLKKYLIERIKKYNMDYSIVTDERINTLALIIPPSKVLKLSKLFYSKYGLTLLKSNLKFDTGERKKFTYLQIYIMPFVTKQIVNNFVNDLPK